MWNVSWIFAAIDWYRINITAKAPAKKPQTAGK